MDELAQIIDRLIKPLRAEAKRGFRNDIIRGSDLGAYVGEWTAKSERAADGKAIAQGLARVRELFADYSALDPEVRRGRVEEALALLQEVPSSAASAARPVAEAPKPARAPRASAQAPPDLSALDAPIEPGRSTRDRWRTHLPKLGILTERDLLYHVPRHHVRVRRIAELEDGERACFAAQVVERTVTAVREGRGKSLTKYLLEVRDDTGTATVVSFARVSPRSRARWSPLVLDFEPETLLLIEGTVKRWGNFVEVAFQDARKIADDEVPAAGQRVPIYPLTEGIYQYQMRRAIRALLARYARAIPDPLPAALRSRHRLMPLGDALWNVHWPDDDGARDRSRRRLAFEELLLLQLAVGAQKREIQQPGGGLVMPTPTGLLDELHRALPFDLTEAQRRVIDEIARDMASDRSMNRLLQGDVGSGKTAVALAAVTIAVRNGYQAALMAPTEILAVQHFLVLSELLRDLGIGAGLLIGSLPARQKGDARERVRAGDDQVVVGTHALIQEAVEFHRLGLVIADEQHRFGVMQRASLRGKGMRPEVLVMTATPIPRSLAMTVYGDLDLSVIDEMPPGRRAVATRWLPLDRQAEAYQFIREQVAAGRQAYIVCPLIEESEKLESEAATRLHVELAGDVFPDLQVGLLHGRMKTADKAATMESFRRGELDVLTTTTVIEVGVDVPNATVMMILNAERFGLAQLHQLRGRVGRGEHQAHCLLVTDRRYDPAPRRAGERALGLMEDEETVSQSRRRLRVLTESNDGFQIAEEDLMIRGPGEFYGIRQSGVPDLKIADLVGDAELLREARQAAMDLLDADPGLARPEHALLAERTRLLRDRVRALPG
jgi:ATP-dependent DNA helicase RecG